MQRAQLCHTVLWRPRQIVIIASCMLFPAVVSCCSLQVRTRTEYSESQRGLHESVACCFNLVPLQVTARLILLPEVCSELYTRAYQTK